MTKRFCLPLLLLAAACSSGKQAVEAPPAASREAVAMAAYSLQITPQAVDRYTVLQVLPKGFNLSDAKVEWLINGSVVASGYTYTPSGARKNDKIQAKAVVQGREVLSDSIVMSNAVPELTKVKLLPEIFRPGDKLYVEAEAADPEDDLVEIRYEWRINGVPAGSSNTIGDTVRRGDRFSVTVTPCDVEGCGKPVIINREMRNMPPMFSKEIPHTFDGDLFVQNLSATDPDGDPITYSLKTGPEGMTVDQATGRVSWTVPPGFLGPVSYTVGASDNSGGETTQTINFRIQ